MIKKKIFVICLCSLICCEIFFPTAAFCSVLWVVPKKFLLPTMVTIFGKHSLFGEEISTRAAVHMHYVLCVCNDVRSIILLLPMMEMSFVLVMLTRLLVSKS